MSLRPLPDLSNDQAMSKLGRLSAIRNARADALHELRDACVRLQNGASVDSVEIANIEEAIARIKQLNEFQAQHA